MFKFEAPEKNQTISAKLAIPRKVHERAETMASEAGVEIEEVLIQALEVAFGTRKRGRRKAAAQA
jgi:hypothetical protein